MRDTRGGGKYKRGEEGGCEEEEGRNIWKRMDGRGSKGKGFKRRGQGSCRTTHRGDAHGDSGTPVLWSDVTAVLPPGLRSKRKHDIISDHVGSRPHTHTHTHTHTQTPTHISREIKSLIHTQAHIDPHTHTHTYIHTYIHSNAQACMSRYTHTGPRFNNIVLSA